MVLIITLAILGMNHKNYKIADLIIIQVMIQAQLAKSKKYVTIKDGK
jgi:hypothetical protein